MKRVLGFKQRIMSHILVIIQCFCLTALLTSHAFTSNRITFKRRLFQQQTLNSKWINSAARGRKGNISKSRVSGVGDRSSSDFEKPAEDSNSSKPKGFAIPKSDAEKVNNREVSTAVAMSPTGQRLLKQSSLEAVKKGLGNVTEQAILTNVLQRYSRIFQSSGSISSVGVASVAEKEVMECIAAFEQCAVLNPMRDTTWYYLAMLNDLVMDKSRAVVSYVEALKVTQDERLKLICSTNLAIVYLELEMAEEAAKLSDAAVKQFPLEPSSWATMGEVLKVTKNYDLAKTCFEKADQLLQIYEEQQNGSSSANVDSSGVSSSSSSSNGGLLLVNKELQFSVYSSLAYLQHTVFGDLTAAERYYRTVLQRLRPDDAPTMLSLALILKDKPDPTFEIQESGVDDVASVGYRLNSNQREALELLESDALMYSEYGLTYDTASYWKQALSGDGPYYCTPDSIVEAQFDEYATSSSSSGNSYDIYLQQSQYAVPAVLKRMLQKHVPYDEDDNDVAAVTDDKNDGSVVADVPAVYLYNATVLDLGVGTGVVGQLLRNELVCAGQLLGCDLSSGMVAHAAALKYQFIEEDEDADEVDTSVDDDSDVGNGSEGTVQTEAVYDRVDKSNLIDFLKQQANRAATVSNGSDNNSASEGYKADIVIAADVLPYFGPLDEVFSRIAKVLRPGGLMFFTIELLNDPTVVTQTLIETSTQESSSSSSAAAAATTAVTSSPLAVATIASGYPLNVMQQQARQYINCDYLLKLHGRFGHRIEYIEEWVLDSFDVFDQQHIVLRFENDEPVHGVAFLMRLTEPVL